MLIIQVKVSEKEKGQQQEWTPGMILDAVVLPEEVEELVLGEN